MTTYLDRDGQPHAGFLRKSREARSIDELIGLCRGILADGQIVQAEAEFIQSWLRSNREIADIYPANILYDRIEAMLSDNRFDLDEERELMALLLDVTGGASNLHLDQTHHATALPLSTPPPAVYFENCSFCVTGKFVSGSRRAVHSTIESLGGLVQNNVTRNLDYLVIGVVSSRDWKHSTHGTKILKAVEYRDTHGLPLAIISEEHWLKYL